MEMQLNCPKMLVQKVKVLISDLVIKTWKKKKDLKSLLCVYILNKTWK